MPPTIRRPIDIPVGNDAAEALQRQLAWDVQTGQKFQTVTGVQLIPLHGEKEAWVVAATLSTSNWAVVEKQRAKVPLTPPRPDGLDGFRTAPLMLEVLVRLRTTPDIIFVRGQGRAHVRKFGVACHIGLALEIPTIGVDLLWPDGCDRTGVMLRRGQRKRGFRTGLVHTATKELVGYELRTQDGQDPVYVSPGHRMDLDSSANRVLQAARLFRMPEPIRQAEYA